MLPFRHSRVHIDHWRSFLVGALVLPYGGGAEKWKTARSTPDVANHMFSCLVVQTHVTWCWHLYLTLNIMCPVKYSKICMKICKLFFDLLGCIWAHTPPVFGCSCITYDRSSLVLSFWNHGTHLNKTLNSNVIELHVPIKREYERVVQRSVQVIRAEDKW